MQYDIYEFTNQGGRSYNEDAVGHAVMDGHGIFIVADGLGGHALGEVASACVCDTMLEGWSGTCDDRSAWLESIIEESNKKILEIQKERDTVLKSTVVALAIDGENACWAHVGDSRLYFFHKDEIAFVTEDHSVAFKKYKAGEITRAQIATDDDQSSLLRTLGNEERHSPQCEKSEDPIVPGDAFLLCSDGAWEHFQDEEAAIDLIKSETAKEWGERLLMRMMDRFSGDNDNLTLLTVIIK